MKLILSSEGLSSERLKREAKRIINKLSENKTAIVIHTAKNPEEEIFVKNAGNELIEAGVSSDKIDYLNIALEKKSSKLDKYFIIYVCGGNTFFILDRLRKLKIDKTIRKLSKSDRIYIGVSAGSIIAGKDIEIAGWGSEGDLNEINLKDLKGIEITDLCVFPHYHEELKKEVEEFRKKINYRVETLKDGEAFIIENGIEKKI